MVSTLKFATVKDCMAALSERRFSGQDLLQSNFMFLFTSQLRKGEREHSSLANQPYTK